MSLDEVDDDLSDEQDEEERGSELDDALGDEEAEEGRNREAERLSKEQLEQTVETWQFVTAADERVCPICLAKDGEIYSGDDMDILFSSAETMGDGDAIDADLHDNCRCMIVPVDISDGGRAEDGDLDLGVALLAAGAGMMFFGMGSRERRRRRR